MQIKVCEQILITAVRTDVLRPGETIEVDDATGAKLLMDHPKHFRAVGGSPIADAVRSEVAKEEAFVKAEAPLLNKRAAAAKNKGG